MSVDFQEDTAENWDMATVMEASDAANGAAAAVEKFSNLDEALAEAGTAMGDLFDNLPLEFRFAWHQKPVFCKVVGEDADIKLILETDLGPFPFTVEDSERRHYLKQLNGSGIKLPIGAFTVTERLRFRHRVSQVLSPPVTGASIVTAIVQTLLAARPYYELANLNGSIRL